MCFAKGRRRVKKLNWFSLLVARRFCFSLGLFFFLGWGLFPFFLDWLLIIFALGYIHNAFCFLLLALRCDDVRLNLDTERTPVGSTSDHRTAISGDQRVSYPENDNSTLLLPCSELEYPKTWGTFFLRRRACSFVYRNARAVNGDFARSFFGSHAPAIGDVHSGQPLLLCQCCVS